MVSISLEVHVPAVPANPHGSCMGISSPKWRQYQYNGPLCATVLYDWPN
jgi:hypothetical protein